MFYLFLLVAGFLPSRGLHENTPNMRGSLISHHLFSWIWASLSDECISLDTVRLCCFALHLFLGWSTGRQQTKSIQKSELKFKISNSGAVLLSLSQCFLPILGHKIPPILRHPCLTLIPFTKPLSSRLWSWRHWWRHVPFRSPYGTRHNFGHMSKTCFNMVFKRVFFYVIVFYIICLLDKLDTCSSHWLARTQQQQQHAKESKIPPSQCAESTECWSLKFAVQMFRM